MALETRLKSLARNEATVSFVKSQLCKIDEIACLCHPMDGHPKVFGMISAYLDESGIHDSASICVVAGYWGYRKPLKLFEKKWVKTLSKFGFQLQEFHAKDWVKSSKYQPVLWELSAIVPQFEVFPVSAGIAVEDFHSFPENDRRFMTGATLNNGKLVTTGCPSKPYFVPFQHVVKTITEYAPEKGKAHFSFGLDTSFSGYATALFKEFKKNSETWDWKDKDKLGQPLFPQASETPQLQAADLLVHLLYLEMQKTLAEGKDKIKPTGLLKNCLGQMLKAGDHRWQNKVELLATLVVAKQGFSSWYTGGVL